MPVDSLTVILVCHVIESSLFELWYEKSDSEFQ